MQNKKSIIFVIKKQELVFIQMHKNNLYWTMPSIITNTNYNIFNGIDFITKKFNWINIKCAFTLFNKKTKYNNQIIETIFYEILITKINTNIYNSEMFFQQFINQFNLQLLINKTAYIKRYLDFIFQNNLK
ncbi:MAG: hypothetical protein U9Q27_02300 [Patescibacteria group bacterium]|nr:hypothetical protein [Patescibacteria group bacterium]